MRLLHWNVLRWFQNRNCSDFARRLLHREPRRILELVLEHSKLGLEGRRLAVTVVGGEILMHRIIWKVVLWKVLVCVVERRLWGKRGMFEL